MSRCDHSCRFCRAVDAGSIGPEDWDRSDCPATVKYQIKQLQRAWYELLASVLRAVNGLFR